MMADAFAAFSSYLINKYFDGNAETIARCIQIHGPLTLKMIERFVTDSLSPKTTLACISALLHHGVLKVCQGDSLTYDLDCRGVSRLSRIPIFCEIGAKIFGPPAGNLLLVVFISGMARASEVLRAALLRSPEDNKYEQAEVLVESLDTLVRSGAVRAFTKSMLLLSPEEYAQFERFSLSKSSLLENLHKFIGSGATCENFRRFLPAIKSSLDWDFILSPNPEYLEALWRDHLFSRLAAQRIDENAGHIMSRILRLAVMSKEHGHVTSPSSDAISTSQIIQGFTDPPEYLDSYLDLLLDDSMSLLELKPGITGGIYICPYKKVVRNILVLHIENIVQVLFENAGLRIFRILLLEGCLSYETLERRLLIPQKEFRKTLPKMVASGFVSTTEFSRSKDFNADTIVCLYTVNLSMVARLTIEYAQHCVLCLATRSEVELHSRSRLTDHRFRVESMIAQHQMKIAKLEKSAEIEGDRKGEKETENDGQEVEETIDSHRESVQALRSSLTPAELGHLSSLSNRLEKLASAQWEAETAWFIADLYLRLFFDKED